MDAKELFLDQHAVVHSAAVGGNKASRGGAGLRRRDRRSDARAPARGPQLARVAPVAHRAGRGHHRQPGAGRARPGPATTRWIKRLGITRRDFGIGMTSAEVTGPHAADRRRARVREYRDAVGRRTREVVERLQAAGLGGRE